MITSNAINENNGSRRAPPGEHGTSPKRTWGHLVAAPFLLLRAHFFTLCLTLVIYYGWLHRDDNYLSAETGAGYLLGILGGSLMLVLLMYPLSKRMALLTRWVPIRYWFGIHMLFGIVGPVMILFHSNFHLGSTNSSIALISMLLVAGSGLVGRYIYTHIHHGLYGKKITLSELKQETENNHTELLSMYDMDEKLNKQLRTMEEKALQPYTSIAASLLHVIYLAVNAHRLKAKVMRLVKQSYTETSGTNKTGTTKPDSIVVVKSINRYTLALRQAAAFRVYERLFSLWHILHLPLFIMMIITAIVHIFAVHMY